MELKDAIIKRRSIRKFKPDPVPGEYIDELLDAARLAPSGTNLQPWRFVVVTGEEARLRVGESTPLPFVRQAPVVLVCCLDTSALKHSDRRIAELNQAGAFQDTGLDKMSPGDYKKFRVSMDSEAAVQAYLGLNVAIAVEHIALRAVDLGLGSCWVMMFSRGKVKKALELPDSIVPVVLMPVGYPAQDPPPRPRLSLEEIVIKRV